MNRTRGRETGTDEERVSGESQIILEFSGVYVVLEEAVAPTHGRVD